MINLSTCCLHDEFIVQVEKILCMPFSIDALQLVTAGEILIEVWNFSIMDWKCPIINQHVIN